jgi:hypothetical protein
MFLEGNKRSVLLSLRLQINRNNKAQIAAKLTVFDAARERSSMAPVAPVAPR